MEVLPKIDSTVVRCAHFGSCGGCKFQDIPYPVQLKNKQAILEELFHPYSVEPIVGCEEPWSYRGKMEFSFSDDKKGNRYLGLMLSGGRGKVFNLEECPISHAWMAETLAAVRSWWESTELKAFYPPQDRGALRTLTLRAGARTGDKMAILTVSGNPDYALTREELNGFTKAVSSAGVISTYLIVQMAVKGKPTTFYEMHLAGPDTIVEIIDGVEFKISPQSFFQPNAVMAEQLFAKARDLLNLTGSERLLDLYCGMGTIGILMAPHVREVIGVELTATNVCSAKEHLERASITNMQIFQGDVGSFLESNRNFFNPDIVVVDPPRVGLDAKTIAALLEMRPKKILYISCNPRTQKENLDILTSEAAGYRVEAIAPFDQFPHTPHVENIILLQSATAS